MIDTNTNTNQKRQTFLASRPPLAHLRMRRIDIYEKCFLLRWSVYISNHQELFQGWYHNSKKQEKDFAFFFPHNLTFALYMHLCSDVHRNISNQRWKFMARGYCFCSEQNEHLFRLIRAVQLTGWTEAAASSGSRPFCRALLRATWRSRSCNSFSCNFQIIWRVLRKVLSLSPVTVADQGYQMNF